jgi:hypothetical protein
MKHGSGITSFPHEIGMGTLRARKTPLPLVRWLAILPIKLRLLTDVEIKVSAQLPRPGMIFRPYVLILKIG